MKKKRNPLLAALASFGALFARLIIPRKNSATALEEEALRTPWKTILINFSRNKLGVAGLVGFIIVFLFSFIGSAVVGNNLNYTELTVANLKPGVNYLKAPKEVTNNASEIKKIASGSSFSVALMNDGSVHIWGTECNQKLNNVSDFIMNIPQEVKDAEIVDIASGGKHVLALGSDGQLYGWGYYANKQTSLPDTYWASKVTSGEIRITQLIATQQWSAVICDDGRLYLWGGTQAETTFIVPYEEEGHLKRAAAGDMNMIILTDDGTVITIGDKGTEYVLSTPPELTDGSVRVVDIASTNRNVLALDDQGKLYLWGSPSDGLSRIPEYDGKVRDIIANYKNFCLLMEDGSVVVWGANDLGQLNVPENMGPIKTVFADYSKFYAIGEDGSFHAWGNKGYIFGTDQYGRDLLTRIIHGGRVSLRVGAIAVAISVVIALLIGMCAGFYGRWVDMLLMRFTDIVMSVPFLPIAVTLSALIGNTMNQMNRLYLIMVIMGVLSWPGLARLVRAQILLEREKDFVLAARALGIRQRNIITRHILPNIFNLVIVNISLGYASALLSEAGLSFLGFGVTEPTPSWGNMLQSAQQLTVIEYYWWRWIIPAIFVVLAALCINLISDALREAMDPKSNDR